VSHFNAGIKVTMKNLCEVMQMPSGAHLLASAEKIDRRRLQQAKRQTLAASKESQARQYSGHKHISQVAIMMTLQC